MTEADATVIATYSRRMRLRLTDGNEVEARIKGKRLKPVCGDRVMAEAIDNEADWLIGSIAPRRNELTRPDRRGRTEVLAANIDCLVAVAAAEPKPDWYIIDRYLCAAELMGIVGIVVYNKIDLDTSPITAADELANYQRIGHDVAQCSASDGTGHSRSRNAHRKPLHDHRRTVRRRQVEHHQPTERWRAAARCDHFR